MEELPSHLSPARRKLVEIITDLLQQWELGFDWKRSRGEPPSDIGLDHDDLVRLDPNDADYRSLLASWHFTEQFVDASWHGFRDLNGIPWEEAVQSLRELAQRLASGEPIDDPRVLAASQQSPREPRIPLLTRVRAWFRGPGNRGGPAPR